MYLALHRGGWQMQKQLGQLLLDKLLIVYDIQESDYSRLLVLMEKYRDRPLIQLPRKFKEPPSGSLTMIAFQNQKSVGG